MNFFNHKKILETVNTGEDESSPYTTSQSWIIESFFIEIYFTLAHRIKGLGWSLPEFMSCDTWTTSKLYCMELELIDEEEKSFNKNKPERNNNPEVEDVYEEMFSE